MRRIKLWIIAAKAHPVLASGAGLTALLAVFSILFADRQIVINTSPSVAPGFYIRSSAFPRVGSIIDFRIPPAAQAYIFARTGNEGSNWYILKPIVAGPGDQVDTTEGSLVINGRRVAPMPPTTDYLGEPLPLWCSRRVLGANEFFVFSDRIPNSFDSRCYGPINQSQIEAVRTPLLTW
jgi:conjugative transfer signal peptidase TraF